jgi:hypothetical protein
MTSFMGSAEMTSFMVPIPRYRATIQRQLFLIAPSDLH